jgi:hypothetical protein
MNEPQMLRNGFIVRPNYETVISITAKRVTATKNMQEMNKVCKIPVKKADYNSNVF